LTLYLSPKRRLDPLTPLRLHRLQPDLRFATVSPALRILSMRFSPKQTLLLLNTPTIPPTLPITPTISSRSIKTYRRKRCNWLGERERIGWKATESRSCEKGKEGWSHQRCPFRFLFFLILVSSGRWDPVLRGRDLDFPNPFFNSSLSSLLVGALPCVSIASPFSLPRLQVMFKV
jgi:hypothetical protein